MKTNTLSTSELLLVRGGSSSGQGPGPKKKEETKSPTLRIDMIDPINTDPVVGDDQKDGGN